MHWPSAKCVMVLGVYVYEPLTQCQRSGQPTRRRCAANSCLAGTWKPVFTSAAVSSVNSSVRPHAYAEPMNQCDWSVCVRMSFLMGCDTGLCNLCVCSCCRFGFRHFLLLKFSQLKGSVHQINKKHTFRSLLVVHSRADSYSFYVQIFCNIRL